jgi:hypothetical protein
MAGLVGRAYNHRGRGDEMPKAVMSALTIGLVVVVCSFAIETSARASQDAAPPPPARTAKAVPAPVPRPTDIQPVPSVVQQMQALERHARVGMLCYKGRFGQPDLAATKTRLPAIALKVEAGPAVK